MFWKRCTFKAIIAVQGSDTGMHSMQEIHIISSGGGWKGRWYELSSEGLSLTRNLARGRNNRRELKEQGTEYKKHE